MKKLDYITILRAIAILAVLLVHVSQIGTGLIYIHPYINSIFESGARGVQLFYLLSAFTLFLSFNKRHADENKPIRNYFIRRFFRIAPMYYIAIVYYLWQGRSQQFSVANIASNFLFLHGLSPYWINSIVPGGWSVGVEVLFYCLLPFFFYKIKNIAHALNFTLIALIIRLVLLIMHNRLKLIPDTQVGWDFLFYYLPNQLPIFGLGFVLFFLLYGEKNVVPLKTTLIYSVIIIIGLAIQPVNFIPDIFYFGVAFLIGAYALHKYHPALLFNPFMRYIGKISYTLYLTHFAAIYLLKKLNLTNIITANNEFYAIFNFIINYLLVLISSVVLSTIFYNAIESPMQNIGKKLIKP